jgi:hypothetical protein
MHTPCAQPHRMSSTCSVALHMHCARRELAPARLGRSLMRSHAHAVELARGRRSARSHALAGAPGRRHARARGGGCYGRANSYAISKPDTSRQTSTRPGRVGAVLVRDRGSRWAGEPCEGGVELAGRLLRVQGRRANADPSMSRQIRGLPVSGQRSLPPMGRGGVRILGGGPSDHLLTHGRSSGIPGWDSSGHQDACELRVCWASGPSARRGLKALASVACRACARRHLQGYPPTFDPAGRCGAGTRSVGPEDDTTLAPPCARDALDHM